MTSCWASGSMPRGWRWCCTETRYPSSCCSCWVATSAVCTVAISISPFTATRHASNGSIPLLVYPPLILYFPYPTYRESHLIHHECDVLTDVATDPESVYLSQAHWNSLNQLSQFIYKINFTLAGRMLIGPFISLYHLWKSESKLILAGDFERARIWLIHIVLCAAHPGLRHHGRHADLEISAVCRLSWNFTDAAALVHRTPLVAGSRRKEPDHRRFIHLPATVSEQQFPLGPSRQTRIALDRNPKSLSPAKSGNPEGERKLLL